MYGKLFDSLYTGSMIGAGCPVFAVWGYVIANMKPDVVVGAQVELNPELLGFILGAKKEEVEGAIRKLCGPDPKSRTKAEEGRRLVRLGEFAYRVVNAKKYLEIKDAEMQREAARKRKRKERALKKGKPLPGEVAAIAAERAGDQNGADAIAEAALPEVPRGTVGPQEERGSAGKTESGLQSPASISGGTAEDRTTPLEMAHNPPVDEPDPDGLEEELE